jgi:hypothetical protein
VANLPDEDVTQDQYIERWEQALRVLESMDEHTRTKHFDMWAWGSVTSCGTVACAAGHCALDPWFRERGLIGVLDDYSMTFTDLQPYEFFGRGGTYAVFHAYESSYDEVLGYVREHIAHLRQGGSPHDIYVDREPDTDDQPEWDDE